LAGPWKTSALTAVALPPGPNSTETVYRKVIVPELRRGAEVMDRLFS